MNILYQSESDSRKSGSKGNVKTLERAKSQMVKSDKVRIIPGRSQSQTGNIFTAPIPQPIPLTPSIYGRPLVTLASSTQLNRQVLTPNLEQYHRTKPCTWQTSGVRLKTPTIRRVSHSGENYLLEFKEHSDQDDSHKIVITPRPDSRAVPHFSQKSTGGYISKSKMTSGREKSSLNIIYSNWSAVERDMAVRNGANTPPPLFKTVVVSNNIPMVNYERTAFPELITEKGWTNQLAASLQKISLTSSNGSERKIESKNGIIRVEPAGKIWLDEQVSASNKVKAIQQPSESTTHSNRNLDSQLNKEKITQFDLHTNNLISQKQNLTKEYKNQNVFTNENIEQKSITQCTSQSLNYKENPNFHKNVIMKQDIMKNNENQCESSNKDLVYYNGDKKTIDEESEDEDIPDRHVLFAEEDEDSEGDYISSPARDVRNIAASEYEPETQMNDETCLDFDNPATSKDNVTSHYFENLTLHSPVPKKADIDFPENAHFCLNNEKRTKDKESSRDDFSESSLSNVSSDCDEIVQNGITAERKGNLRRPKESCVLMESTTKRVAFANILEDVMYIPARLNRRRRKKWANIKS